jgi:transketolase C-terminal domain/subunit
LYASLPATRKSIAIYSRFMRPLRSPSGRERFQMGNWQLVPDGKTIIMLELATEAAAFKAAKELAEKTGRTVTIRDQDGALIGTVEPTRH